MSFIMNERGSDILVKIPDEQLPELAPFYQEKASWAPHLVGFVQTLIKWKKSDKYKNTINLYSPNNCWREDGTVVAISKLFTQDLFVFTLDDKCANLYKGLKETNLINYDERTLLHAIHEKHYQTVKTCLEEKQVKISASIPNFFYAISPEEAKTFTIKCPPEVYVRKLEPSASKEMNELWPHKFTDSEKYIAAYIEMNGGYGVFLKSTDEMVAWIIRSMFVRLGILQTKDEHGRKGYASLVTKVLSKEIAEEEFPPLGTILQANKSSIGMFEKMGFRCMGVCYYIIIDH